MTSQSQALTGVGASSPAPDGLGVSTVSIPSISIDMKNDDPPQSSSTGGDTAATTGASATTNPSETPKQTEHDGKENTKDGKVAENHSAADDDSKKQTSIQPSDAGTRLRYLTIEGEFKPNANLPKSAAALTPAQWQTVLEHTGVLCGYQIRNQVPDIVRARKPAFILSGSRNQATLMVKPDFHILDDSSIKIKEVQNDFQRSLAEESFSSKCIQSELASGIPGAEAGILASWQKSRKRSSSTKNSGAVQEYYGVYNFPRARLFLDEHNLELSTECANEIETLRKLHRGPQNDNEAAYRRLTRFFQLFGHFYVTSVQIGGQQRTSKLATASTRSAKDEVESALKTAVGASVSAQFASVASKYSSERRKVAAETSQTIGDLSQLAMSATGGDTLTGPNVPEWASTIASYEMWRVIEQEVTIPLPSLIGKIQGYEDVPQLFTAVSHQSHHQKWNGRIRLLLQNGAQESRKLFWNVNDGKALCPVSELRIVEGEEAVFTIFDADLGWEGMDKAGVLRLPYLRPDHPIFMDTDPTTPGNNLCVDRDGSLRSKSSSVPRQANFYQRFSLREAGDQSRWKPVCDPPRILKSGSLVNLYCHSVGLGPFARVDSPPASASGVYYAAEYERLLVRQFPSVISPDRLVDPSVERRLEDIRTHSIALQVEYDSGGLLPEYQLAFESMGFVDERVWEVNTVAKICNYDEDWKQYVRDASKSLMPPSIRGSSPTGSSTTAHRGDRGSSSLFKRRAKSPTRTENTELNQHPASSEKYPSRSGQPVVGFKNFRDPPWIAEPSWNSSEGGRQFSRNVDWEKIRSDAWDVQNESNSFIRSLLLQSTREKPKLELAVFRVVYD